MICHFCHKILGVQIFVGNYIYIFFYVVQFQAFRRYIVAKNTLCVSRSLAGLSWSNHLMSSAGQLSGPAGFVVYL